MVTTVELMIMTRSWHTARACAGLQDKNCHRSISMQHTERRVQAARTRLAGRCEQEEQGLTCEYAIAGFSDRP